MVNCNFWIRKF